ncbi:hypothetical protein B0H14DRAFT_2573432 [Mycena olivaceomarginata]|nr:hypothetical protein B0H14DRAFT_2573432 [Mycena olivaceomarginata]
MLSRIYAGRELGERLPVRKEKPLGVEDGGRRESRRKGNRIDGDESKEIQRIEKGIIKERNGRSTLKKTYPAEPEWGWHTNGASQHDMQEKRRGKTNGDNAAWSNCKWLNTRRTAVARKHSKRPYEWS